MTSSEMEQELKEIDSRLSVVENPNRPGLSNIFFMGKNFDLPAISTHLITDEIDNSNRYEFPNGWSQRHHTRPEIIEKVKLFLSNFKAGKLNIYNEK